MKVAQETRYPWDGAVKITIAPPQRATVRGERPHPRLGAQRAGAERSLSLPRQGAPAATVTVNGQPCR